MLKKILKGILFIVICTGISVCIPVIVEEIIVNGICGFKVSTYLGNEEWFSFYGSYLGSIITIAIFFITLRKDKKQIIGEIKKQKIKEKYSSEKEVAKEIVSLLALDKYYSDPCREISFSAVNIFRNDIRRVELLMEDLIDYEFTNKVNQCLKKYKNTDLNNADRSTITITKLIEDINKLKDYYLKCEIDEAYLDFLKEINEKETQELEQMK